MQMTIGNGKRCSGAVGYLRPAMARPNLRVETKALVTRIAFEGRRAVGVDYVQDGKTASVRAEREVIVAGGTINSPQTLMLSGIGDPDALKAHGIPVNVALRGVGQNLQDHPTTLVTYARVEGGPLYRNMRMDRLAVALADAYLRGRGFATSLPSGVTAFLKSDPGETLPDIQLLFVAAPFGAKPYLPFAKPPFADGFALRAVVLRPESRGHIALASADPAAKPRIHQSLLATEEDWRRMKAAIRLFRDLVNRGPVQRFVKGELMPGKDATSDAALEAHARKTAITVHHPCGTCRMGAVADETAVVDPELKVRGVDGLRVVDASVFPDLVGGNINAAVVMIAEKAADMIRGRAPLPPAAV
jgi:choline dehydrogenase/4-pyridoxate dehydrogenase